MKLRHVVPAVICSLLIGYPLSLGPVVRANMMMKAKRPYLLVDERQHLLGPVSPVERKLYAPVFWLSSRSPILWDCLDWYLHRWVSGEIWIQGY